MLLNFGFLNLVGGLFKCNKICFEIVNDDC